MKRIMKKVSAILLTMMMLVSFATMSVNAAEVRDYLYGSHNDGTRGVTIMKYMHYYYDSSNPNKLTKIGAATDLVATQASTVITQYQVYVYTIIDVTYTNGERDILYSRGEAFDLGAGVHEGDTMLSEFPYDMNTTLTPKTIITRHGLATYNANAHVNDNHKDEHFKTIYPMTGESSLYSYILVY